MEDGCCQYRGCFTDCHSIIKVLQLTGTAGGGNRNTDCFGHGLSHLQVVSFPGPVGILAGEEYLAGTQSFHPLRPVDDVDTGALIAALDDYLQPGESAVR